MADYKPTSAMRLADLVNTTPHAISVHTDGGAIVTIEPDQSYQLRAESAPLQQVDAIEGVPVFDPPNFSRVEGKIPVGRDILVSMPVGQYFKTHLREHVGDVYGPETGAGNVVRDAEGRIIGTRALIKYA